MAAIEEAREGREFEKRETGMNDDIEKRRAAKFRALKAGCCMWSPILPPVVKETEEVIAAPEHDTGGASSLGVLHGAQIGSVPVTVD